MRYSVTARIVRPKLRFLAIVDAYSDLIFISKLIAWSGMSVAREDDI